MYTDFFEFLRAVGQTFAYNPERPSALDEDLAVLDDMIPLLFYPATKSNSLRLMSNGKRSG